MMYVLSAKEMTAAILRYVVQEHFTDKPGSYNADVRLSFNEHTGEFTAEVSEIKRTEE